MDVTFKYWSKKLHSKNIPGASALVRLEVNNSYFDFIESLMSAVKNGQEFQME